MAVWPFSSRMLTLSIALRAVGFVLALVGVSGSQGTTGFTHTNWATVPCAAWDSKSRLDFSDSKGLTFAWYDSSRTTSFVYTVCGEVVQYYGIDITSTTCTDCGNSMGSFTEANIFRDTTAADYSSTDLSTWSSVDHILMQHKRGSQGPPCNNVYDRVSSRTVKDPPGKHSPLAAGRSTQVQLYCSTCVIGSTGCSPCPNGGSCIATPVTTNPVTGVATNPSSDPKACICSTSAAVTVPCKESIVVVVSCPSETDQEQVTEKVLIVLALCCVLAVFSCIASSALHKQTATQSNNLLLRCFRSFSFHLFSDAGCVRRCFASTDEEVNENQRVQQMNDHMCVMINERANSQQHSRVQYCEKQMLHASRGLTKAHLETTRVKNAALNQGFGFKGFE